MTAGTPASGKRPLSRPPFLHNGARAAMYVNWRLIALLPGALPSIWFYGPGMAVNILLCIGTAIGIDWLLHAVNPPPAQIGGLAIDTPAADGNMLIMAIVLGLLLPPQVSFMLPIAGGLFMILLGKQLFGGVGQYPFHPAMVAYLLLTLFFAASLHAWPAPSTDLALDFTVLSHKWAPPIAGLPESMSQAASSIGSAGNASWPTILISAGFLVGALLALHKRVISWHLPLATLTTMALLCLLSTNLRGIPWSLFSQQFLYSPLLLLLFWVATEMATSPVTARGKLLAGILLGCGVFFSRQANGDAGGLAAVIILLNLAAPLLDYAVLQAKRRLLARHDHTLPMGDGHE